MDDHLRRLVEELGTAINAALGESPRIAGVMSDIKRSGHDVSLILNATVAVKARESCRLSGRPLGSAECRFNSEDLEFLRSLHICVNR